MPWRLILGNLRAHWLRSLLTAGSLVIAVFLICLLRSLIVALNAGVAGAASNRLVVQSAVSLFVDLPLAYQGKIDAALGARGRSCKFQWFGGYYQEQKNFFAQFGVDADRFFEAYPEVELVAGDAKTFEQTRTACLIGRTIAEKYGFGVGDRVPITGTIFQRNDGQPWTFDVAGVYRSRSSNVDENTLFFRFDYLNESLESDAASGPPGVGVFMVKLTPGASPEAVAAELDALFDQGPQRVQTTTEAEFQRQFVSMLGNVPTFLTSIGGGVLFSILLAVLNTMLMAGRERTRDIGIMKALGFGDGVAFALLMCESLLLCGVGGAGGVALALATEDGLEKALAQMFPVYEVTPETIALGLGLSLGLGALAGLVPALSARRLRVIQAMRPEP